MKRYISLFILGAILIGFTACEDKFDEYNTNPNTTTKVTPSMLATNLILSTITQYNYTDKTNRGKGFMFGPMLSKYITWEETNDIDYAFNKLGRQSFSGLTVLVNVDKMVEAAPEGGQRNSYEALGHVLRAIKFFDMSMHVGDMPYSEAFLGESGNVTPKYDTQKEVMLGVLNELEEADKLFAQGETFSGDPVYGGDPAKWRKACNAFELRVLINLYKKTGDADLNVKGRMQSIVSGKPLFESNADNLQLVHSATALMAYPFYKDGNNYVNYAFISAVVVDALKQLGDYRLFAYANPSPNATAASADPSSFDSYGGVEPSLTMDAIQTRMASGDASRINSRYSEVPEGEPTYVISYSEQEFILAEAAVRGLISGDAKTHYENGIRSAMQFTADNTPSEYTHGRAITASYITEYLTHEGVAFASDATTQIRQIIVQKYLAEYLNAPYNAWFEYRRTGYPELKINPESNMNQPSTKMPVRWMYSQDEYDHNSDNVTAAVQSQFGGVDDENQVMWILK